MLNRQSIISNIKKICIDRGLFSVYLLGMIIVIALFRFQDFYSLHKIFS